MRHNLVIIILILLLAKISFASDTMYDRAKPYLPIMDEIYGKYWPTLVTKRIPPAQIEQESSWKPKARLHTSREDGYGLGQITVTPRFNNFLDAINYKPLRNWDWKNDPYNVRNQITYLVLKDKDNYNLNKKYIKGEEEIFRCTLVSYNAGWGRILKRRQYAISKGLPHNRWTGGLELAHGPLEDKLLYGEPLWKAINSYPKIIFKRSEKYRNYFKDSK